MKKWPLLSDEEYQSLVNVTTEEQWDAACDAIKASRDGEYPADWWPRIVGSGLLGLKSLLWEEL